MKWDDAIIRTLEELNKPATSTDILEHILDRKYRVPKPTDTPDRTVAAQLGLIIEKPLYGVKRSKGEGRSFLYYLIKNETDVEVKKNENLVQKNKQPNSKYKAEKAIPNNDGTDSFSGRFDEGVENEDEELQPFDPEKISLDSKKFTMDGILRRFEQGTIKLDPDFQRKEVWTDEKKSRLMESIMLKIPIPMFYVSADEKGEFPARCKTKKLQTYSMPVAFFNE